MKSSLTKAGRLAAKTRDAEVGYSALELVIDSLRQWLITSANIHTDGTSKVENCGFGWRTAEQYLVSSSSSSSTNFIATQVLQKLQVVK